jgi:hypothetical protein
MDPSQLHSQYCWNPSSVHDFRIANRSTNAYGAPGYQQNPHFQHFYHGAPPPEVHHVSTLIPKRQGPIARAPYLHQNFAKTAQAAAYADAVITEVWHDEWEAEADKFGSSRPLCLLNQSANIDLEYHTWQTSLVQLCHWDREHKPYGAIAQRLARKKRNREKGRLSRYGGAEEDKRRKRVKLAARSAEVIDLTKDCAVAEGRPRSYTGFEIAGNYLPESVAYPWMFQS